MPNFQIQNNENIDLVSPYTKFSGKTIPGLGQVNLATIYLRAKLRILKSEVLQIQFPLTFLQFNGAYHKFQKLYQYYQQLDARKASILYANWETLPHMYDINLNREIHLWKETHPPLTATAFFSSKIGTIRSSSNST